MFFYSFFDGRDAFFFRVEWAGNGRLPVFEINDSVIPSFHDYKILLFFLSSKTFPKGTNSLEDVAFLMKYL